MIIYLINYMTIFSLVLKEKYNLFKNKIDNIINFYNY